MQTEKLNLISIIIPCYNAGRFIKDAIESVIKQTYSNWELIIIDDGSSDNCLKIIGNYIKDKRIILCKQKHLGACAARNKGIELAKGEYVKFLDADDVLFADCLSKQVSQINNLKENQIPFGDYQHIDETGNLISNFVFSDNQSMLDVLKEDQSFFFFKYWHVLISAPLLRRRDLIKIGGFDKKLKRGQEYDMHFRLALEGVEFIYIPCLTFAYREYTSENRITSIGRVNKHIMEEYALQRVLKIDSLLRTYYGTIPNKYSSYFVNYWFDAARVDFNNKNKIEGIKKIKNALRYEYRNSFIIFYYYVGKFIGYINLESLLKFRLQIKKIISTRVKNFI